VHEIEIHDGQRPRVQYLFARNIIKVVRELIGNPAFQEYMQYAPEKQWTTEEKLVRVFSDMWTADWWWRMQVSV
jgi:hypothetical protein